MDKKQRQAKSLPLKTILWVSDKKQKAFYAFYHTG
jgi:hypothetical protein